MYNLGEDGMVAAVVGDSLVGVNLVVGVEFGEDGKVEAEMLIAESL